jgi:hypothetical protein
MDVNTKVKELEDELKVLKTEIRNVLLDVREVILDRANPLSEQEPAYLRVDLKTTAQAIAAEEAARSAADSAEEAARAAAKAAEQKKAEEHPKEELEQPEEPEESDTLAPLSEDEGEAEEQPTGEESTEDETTAQAEDELEEPDDTAEPEPSPEEETPRKRKRRPQAGPELAEISAAYALYPPLTVGTVSLAAWVAQAMAAIGPQQLDRVITIHRLWGCLPPNISQALAHLQELIRCSQEVEPPWLKIMQDMERLSSS